LIEMERLEAFATGRAPNFVPFTEKYPSMVKEAQSLHSEQVRQLERSLEQQDRQIDEERTSLAAAERQIPAAQSSLEATKKLLARTRDGVRRGIIALSRQAQVEEQAAQSERVHTQLVTSLDQYKSRIKRLEAERASILSKATSDARNQ